MDSGLPEGWESDYDGKRWLYRYKATGAVQYRWPQPGDEYPDFVDSGIDAMEPEDRLATQQQSRSRKANVNETRKPHDSRMSATAGPVSFYNNEEFGNIEFFQPDALMYMGPGAYTDISPMGAEDIEQPLPDNVAELPNMPMGARVSPIASEKSTPKTTNANLNNSHQGQENIIDGGFFISVAELPHTAPVAELSSMSTASLPATNMIQPPPPPPPPRPRPVEYDFPMLDGREIQSATNRFASVSDPVGFMAEMATEFTGLSQEELDPVEMGDYRVLAPAEKAACIVPDIPELPSNFSSERMNLKDEEDAHKKKIQAQQRPYGDRQYPFQPRDDVIDPISIPSQSQPSVHTTTSPQTPVDNAPRFRAFSPGATISHKRELNPGTQINSKPLGIGGDMPDEKSHITTATAPPSLRPNPHRFRQNQSVKPPATFAGQTTQAKAPTPPILSGVDAHNQPPLALRPGILVSESIVSAAVDSQPKAEQNSKPVLPYPVDDEHEYNFSQLPPREAPMVSHIREHRAASFPTMPRRVNEGNGIPNSSYNPIQLRSDLRASSHGSLVLQHKSNTMISDSSNPINGPSSRSVNPTAPLTKAQQQHKIDSVAQDCGPSLESFSTRVSRPTSMGAFNEKAHVLPLAVGYQRGPQSQNAPHHRPQFDPGNSHQNPVSDTSRRHSIGGPMKLTTPPGPQSIENAPIAPPRPSQTAGPLYSVSQTDSFASRRPFVPESVPEHPEEDPSLSSNQRPSKFPRPTINPPVEHKLRRYSLGVGKENSRQRPSTNRNSLLSTRDLTRPDLNAPFTPESRLGTRPNTTSNRPASVFIMTELPDHSISRDEGPPRTSIPSNTLHTVLEQASLSNSQRNAHAAELPDTSVPKPSAALENNGKTVSETPTPKSSTNAPTPVVTVPPLERAPSQQSTATPSRQKSQNSNTSTPLNSRAITPLVSRHATAPVSRPLSLPPPSRIATLSPINTSTVSQPRQIYRPAPAPQEPLLTTKEPKEKGKWLSRLFKSSRRRSLPPSSFKVLSLPRTSPTPMDPPSISTPSKIPAVSSPMARPSILQTPEPDSIPISNGKEDHSEDVLPEVHQDGLRSHAPFPSTPCTQEENSANTKSLASNSTPEDSSPVPLKVETPVVVVSLEQASPPTECSATVESPPSPIFEAVGAPSLLPSSVSRAGSQHSNTQSILISEAGTSEIDHDLISDQASVSTMDISEAQARPILRPQLVQVSSHNSARKTISVDKPPSLLLMDKADKHVDNSIAPLKLKKKYDRQSLPASFEPVPLNLKVSAQASTSTECNNLAAQDCTRSSQSDVLEAELMDALISYQESDILEEGTFELMDDSSVFHSKPSSESKQEVQSEMLVEPLSTPRRQSVSSSGMASPTSAPLRIAFVSTPPMDSQAEICAVSDKMLQKQADVHGVLKGSKDVHLSAVGYSQTFGTKPSRGNSQWKKSPVPDYTGGEWEEGDWY